MMVSPRKQYIFSALCATLACTSGRAFPLGLPTQRTHTRQQNSVGTPSGSTVILNQQARQESMPMPERGGGQQLSLSNANKKALLSTAALSIAVITQRQLLSQIFSVALNRYQNSLITYPLRTKVLTGASLAVIGDYLAQKQDTSKDEYDVPRAMSFAAFDSCYRMFQHVAIPLIVALGTGNVFHSIFTKIPFSSLAINAGAESSMAFFAAMERTFLYQFGLIPFFYYPVFFTFTGLMQGLNLKQTVQRAKESFLPCWKRNLIFWIPTQMVMFGLVPSEWQIPFVCVMGILWSMILSVTAGKAKQS